jgi:hypothetical protein
VHLLELSMGSALAVTTAMIFLLRIGMAGGDSPPMIKHFGGAVIPPRNGW